MKSISTKVYEDLTPKQRVHASLEAIARGDGAEKQKLINTCPKKAYIQNVPEYADTMEILIGMMMAVECDIYRNALNFFAALYFDHEAKGKCLQNIADIKAAWKAALIEKEIDPDLVKKAGSKPSPVIELIEEILPKPKDESTKALTNEITSYFSVSST